MNAVFNIDFFLGLPLAILRQSGEAKVLNGKLRNEPAVWGIQASYGVACLLLLRVLLDALKFGVIGLVRVRPFSVIIFKLLFVLFDAWLSILISDSETASDFGVVGSIRLVWCILYFFMRDRSRTLVSMVVLVHLILNVHLLHSLAVILDQSGHAQVLGAK